MFSHKAFLFQYDDFKKGLADIMYASLETGSSELIAEFLMYHVNDVRDPDDGSIASIQALQKEQFCDVQRACDVALTVYYSPLHDIGLSDQWSKFCEVADEIEANLFEVLLGESFGPVESMFDPGGMGSYFQSPSAVRDNVRRATAAGRKHADRMIESASEILTTAASNACGLYVTF